MLKLVYVLFFALVFVIALLFSFKNLQPVSIHLFLGSIRVPLALALTVELLAGVAIGVAVSIARLLRMKAENAGLKKGLVLAEQEIESLRSQLPHSEH